MRVRLCPSLSTRAHDISPRNSATVNNSESSTVPARTANSTSATRLARCKCGCTIPRRRRCWEEIIILFRPRTPISTITSRMFLPCFPCHNNTRPTVVADDTDASMTLKGSSSYADTLNVSLRPAKEVTVTFGPLSSLSTIELGAHPRRKKKRARSKSTLALQNYGYSEHTLKRQRAFENVRDAATEGFLIAPDIGDESGEMELFELKELMKPVFWKD